MDRLNKVKTKGMKLYSNITFFLSFIGLLTISSSLQYEFNQRPFMIPHPKKAYRGGEDAYFANNQLLIVADGVGGWIDFGVDAGFYSRFLCSMGSQLLEMDKDYYRQNPVQLIADSTRFNPFVGSSTMAVVMLKEDHLRTCYIGDSGFLIFRLVDGHYRLHFEFKDQQHLFNTPFQLSLQQYYGDDPYLSICKDFKIQQDDIVIVATDGLFDNVFVSEILDIVNQNFMEEEKLLGLAQKLAEMSIERGQDRSFNSPFAQKAIQYNVTFRGGKLDDTTVIVSKIRKVQQKLFDIQTQELSNFEHAKNQEAQFEQAELERICRPYINRLKIDLEEGNRDKRHLKAKNEKI